MHGWRRVLKWIGIGLAALVGVVLVAGVVLYFVGGSRVNQTYELAVEEVPIPTDAESIARGQHLAAILVCTDCHGANLGGNSSFSIPGMLTIPTPNLTRGAGGVGSAFTDADWVRAIRHGVGKDGRALMIMPAGAFSQLSKDDLGALIAWVKSVPPVDSDLPPRSIDLLGRMMAAVGMFPPSAVEKIDHAAPFASGPKEGDSLAMGAYLTRTCTECHGADLNGALFGPPGQEVPTPNLTPGGELNGWSKDDFFTLLRSGVTPTGRSISEEMPWRAFGQMTDEELDAVWLYLHSLPALPQGG